MPTVIRAIRTGGSNEEVALKASRDGDLRISQYLPPFAMLCAAGKVFAFDMTAGTAKQPDTAVPTDSPEWSIYNANPEGGPHLVLLHVGVSLASGSAGYGLAILAASGVGEQTAQVADYTSAIVSCLDGTAKKPNAFIANNISIIGTQPSWIALDAQDITDRGATSAIGQGCVARVDGLVSAPPESSIFIAVVGLAAATAPLFDITLIVAEVLLDT